MFSESGASKKGKDSNSPWFLSEVSSIFLHSEACSVYVFMLVQGTKSPGSFETRSFGDTASIKFDSLPSTFPERAANRSAVLRDEMVPSAMLEAESAPTPGVSLRREISRNTLNSLLQLIVNILRNSGGELKATDGANCLKSILQREMPSAIKDISDAGGLTRFCEIHSSYLEFISDGCGSGNIRLKGRGKTIAGASQSPHLFGSAPGPAIFSGDSNTYRIGDSQTFGGEPSLAQTPVGLYGDWSAGGTDHVPSSPALAGQRLPNGDEPAPKVWSRWGHGTAQDNVSSDSKLPSALSRGIHGSFSIVVNDDDSERIGLNNGLIDSGKGKAGAASAVIIANDRVEEKTGEDLLDGLRSASFGTSGDASSPGQISLLSAGSQFAAVQGNEPSPRPPRRLGAFAQMSERQAYEAFTSPGLSYTASTFNPGSAARLGGLSEEQDLDLGKSRFRAGEGLRAFSSVRGEHDVVIPLRASPASRIVSYEETASGMKDLTLPFAAAAGEPHQTSFLLSDFERPGSSGVFGDTGHLSHFIKDLDPVDSATGSNLPREAGSLDYLSGEKGGEGFIPGEIDSYFSNIGLGVQRKMLQSGSDVFLLDPHALPDGLAPWVSGENGFTTATYLDKSGTPQNISEFREGIGRVLLEKLVDILRQENGELLASLAPDKLYTSVPRGKEEITAVGGLRKFCLLYPEDLEFIADTGGRCRIRLCRSSTFDVPLWSLQDGIPDAPKQATRDGRRRDEGDGTAPPGGCEIGAEEPRKPEVRRTAAVERLVGILRAEGGDMSATQATSKLYKALPRAKEDVVAAGGLRKFCELFPTDLEFVADLQGRCRIRARRATKGSRGSGRAERAAKEAQDSKGSSRSSSAARPPLGGQATNAQSSSSGLDGGLAAVAAAAAAAAAGTGGDVPLIMPISKEATTTLQRLVGILRGEGGEMYAARAPEVGLIYGET